MAIFSDYCFESLSLQIGDSTLVVDSKEAPSTSCSSACFKNGVVNFNGDSLTLLGKYEDASLSVVLSNSRSYSRVEVTSQVLSAKVGWSAKTVISFSFFKIAEVDNEDEDALS